LMNYPRLPGEVEASEVPESNLALYNKEC